MEALTNTDVHFCEECRFFGRKQTVDSFVCIASGQSLNWHSRACSNIFEPVEYEYDFDEEED